MMYGMWTNPRHWLILTWLRDIQDCTGGFTEFVLLPFVHQNSLVPGRCGAPRAHRANRGTCLARIMLHGRISHTRPARKLGVAHPGYSKVAPTIWRHADGGRPSRGRPVPNTDRPRPSLSWSRSPKAVAWRQRHHIRPACGLALGDDAGPRCGPLRAGHLAQPGDDAWS